MNTVWTPLPVQRAHAWRASCAEVEKGVARNSRFLSVSLKSAESEPVVFKRGRDHGVEHRYKLQNRSLMFTIQSLVNFTVGLHVPSLRH